MTGLDLAMEDGQHSVLGPDGVLERVHHVREGLQVRTRREVACGMLLLAPQPSFGGSHRALQ